MTLNVLDMYREHGSSQTLSYLGTGIAHCELMVYSWYLYTDRVIVGEKTIAYMYIVARDSMVNLWADRSHLEYLRG